jgi:hypothetical protein
MADDADHVSDKVDALVHELLTPDERERVERHCGECPSCGALLTEARERLRDIQSLPPAVASEELILRTEQRLARRTRPWFRPFGPIRVAVAAAVALIAFTAAWQWYLESLTTSPFDLCVLGQTRLLAGADSSLRVIVTEQAFGSPLAWVPVEIALTSKQSGQSVTLARFQTDIHGTGSPRFRLPEWEDGDCELSVVAHPRGAKEEIRRTVKLGRSWQVILSTDRPVYQPGQSLLFRSLALRQPDRRPVGGQKAVFTVTDPKGNKIFQEEKSTSRFGIASAELPLAEEITEGTYQVECRVGESQGGTTVEVKKYALPKFKVAVTTDRNYYKPGETIRLKVRADYFFGKPVADMEVSVDVRTPADPGKVIDKHSTHAAEAGVAELQFPAPVVRTGQAGERDAEVLLDVRVTDSAGQEQGTTITRPVSSQPFRIEAIPEGGELVRWVPNTVYLMAFYPDGRPARAELEVAGYPDKLHTDQFGVATLKLTPPASGEVVLKVRARDADGLTGEREAKLGFDDRDGEFLVHTDKAVYDGGETMHVAVRGEDGIVFFDLLQDSQVLLTGSVGVSRSRGECSVDLPSGLAGPVVLSAYTRGQFGFSGTKTRVIYVRPGGRKLDVRAAAERKEYRPGQVARVSFQLKDAAGKPAPGALSLAAVNEAVYSVLGQTPEAISGLSPGEMRRLQPVRSLYPSWSPDASASGAADERARLDLALFAGTAGRGGELEQDAVKQQLLPFLEGSDVPLKVLERPDWQELSPGVNLPPDVLAALRKDTRFSLSASSHGDSSRRIAEEQRKGLTVVWAIWGTLILVTAVAVFILLVYRLVNSLEDLFGLLLLIVCPGILVGLLLPRVQAVREAAPRTQAANDLRQVELAVLNYRAVYGKMPGATAGTPEGPRVRQWFPETLLWLPEVVTDDEGRAEVEVPLADSITDWRLTASAVTADGRLGSTRTSVRVFQPFFVDVNPPATLTRGDEIAFPVVVYNYLEKPQTVTLTLENAAWFERLDEAVKKLNLGPGEVRSLSFRIRCLRVGRQELQVTARGEGVSDALRRKVEVVPDGPRTETVANGDLRNPAEIDLSVPDDAVEGSVAVLLRVYPSGFSQLVEGLDGIFRLPYGCFEQTSSVTYPNVLALDYLRRTGRSAPEVEAKARKYIQLGYQRLLTFEVSGGGFDWFGRAPANRTLTAYGLMEFEDMARVYPVDPDLPARTRKWLLDQRQSDGTWKPEGHQFAGDPARGGAESAVLGTTAYIAAAVFTDGRDPERSRETHDFLLRHKPSSIRDPYTLALVCNALLAIEPQGDAVTPYLVALREMKRLAGAGQYVWWEAGPEGRTLFYGAGRCGDVETTALACLALLKGGQAPEAVRGGLAWLVLRRGSAGTWGSTQATVLALKALLAGTANAAERNPARRVEIALDGKAVQELTIPADQSEVMKQVNLAPLVARGRHRLRLTDLNHSAVAYQVAFSYHTAPRAEAGRDLLALQVSYDRSKLRSGEFVTALASVSNRGSGPAPMVMVEVPLPPGFTLETEELTKLVEAGTAAKFQQAPGKSLLYLRSLNPGQTLQFKYRLRATMPGTVTAAPAVAYEYYDPDRVSRTVAVRLHVSEAD